MEHQADGRPLPASLAQECLGGLVLADPGAAAAQMAAALAASGDVLVLAGAPASGALPVALAQLTVLAHSAGRDQRLLLLRASREQDLNIVRMDCTIPVQECPQLPETGSVLLWESEPCEGIPPIIKTFFTTVDKAMMRSVNR